MIPMLVESAVRSLVVAVAAGVGIRLFRVRSPQTRHAVWAAVLAIAVCMPLLPALMQSLIPAERPVATVALPSQVFFVDVTPGVAIPAAAAASTRWMLIGYATVAMAMLVRVLAGLLLAWRITGSARRLPDDVAASTRVNTPATFGRLILLPEGFEQWPLETLQAVLRHEQAHRRRGDFYVQLAAKIYRAVFWFNPMSWWLDRHLAALAEQACDDAVIRSRTEPASYASLLLTFAAKPALAIESGVAMARLSSVGKRVERLLDAAFQPGAELTAVMKCWIAAAVLPCALLAAVFSIALQAQQTPTPPQAPKPAAKSKSSGGTQFLSQDGDHDDRAFVIVESADSTTMSGSMRDVRRARELRSRGTQTPYLWFRILDSEYLVENRAEVERALAMFQPQRELGRKQAELGEQQAKLGKLQAELGEQQAAVQVDMPDLTNQVRELSKKLSALANRKAEMDEIGQLQSQLGELQSRLGEVQGSAGVKQGELGQKQGELGRQQGELGARQGELGRQQGEAARKANAEMQRLVETLIRDGKAKRLP